jgi:hypothetical protein
MHRETFFGSFKGIHVIGSAIIMVWFFLFRIFYLSLSMLISGRHTTYFYRLRPEPSFLKTEDDDNALSSAFTASDANAVQMVEGDHTRQVSNSNGSGKQESSDGQSNNSSGNKDHEDSQQTSQTDRSQG